MTRRAVVVHGSVQGVGFREGLRRQAEWHGVRGWARNEPDGTVRAELEGDGAAVETVLAWCERGPRLARVSRVEVTDLAQTGEPGFRVR